MATTSRIEWIRGLFPCGGVYSVLVIYSMVLIIPLIIFKLFIWGRLARLSLPLLEAVWVPELLGQIKHLIFTVIISGLLMWGMSQIPEGPAGS